MKNIRHNRKLSLRCLAAVGLIPAALLALLVLVPVVLPASAASAAALPPGFTRQGPGQSCGAGTFAVFGVCAPCRYNPSQCSPPAPKPVSPKATEKTDKGATNSGDQKVPVSTISKKEAPGYGLGVKKRKQGNARCLQSLRRAGIHFHSRPSSSRQVLVQCRQILRPERCLPCWDAQADQRRIRAVLVRQQPQRLQHQPPSQRAHRLHARRNCYSQQRYVFVLPKHERQRGSSEKVSLCAEQKLHLCVCSAHHRSGDCASDEKTSAAFHRCAPASLRSDLCSAHCGPAFRFAAALCRWSA